MKLEEILTFIKGFFSSFKKGSTEMIEFELRELENIFALIQMGFFVGIPTPPPTVIMKTLPHMAREIYVMTKRVSDEDVLTEMAGLFDVT